MRTLFIEAELITPFRIVPEGSILIENDQIIAVGQNDIDRGEADRVISLGGCYLTPGFIDIHSHGGGGYDFMDGTLEAVMKACRAHLKHGTTSIIPTTLSAVKEEMFSTLNNIRRARDELKEGPSILGAHLEGPYFASSQAGAQDPKYIRNPEPEEYLSILEEAEDIIVRWTAAPELPGALKLGCELRKRGILASIGHTEALYEDVLSALENGYSLMTHLYSGMSGVRRVEAYRHAGTVESAYLCDEITVEVIADGAHLPASLLQLIYKIKGPDRICLITDSIRAAGMPEGTYILGSRKRGYEVIVEDGVAKVKDRTAFAGSVATTDRLLSTMYNLAEVPLIDVIKMMTFTPAQVMGLENNKGMLAPGYDADLVVFNDNLKVQLVVSRGHFTDIDGQDEIKL